MAMNSLGCYCGKCISDPDLEEHLTAEHGDNFEYHTAVNVTCYTPGTNVFGHKFNLQDYLKFGMVSADTQEELLETLSERNSAAEIATQKLNNYFMIDYYPVLYF